MVARTFYNENHVALPMPHDIHSNGDSRLAVEYGWRSCSGWSRLSLTVEGPPEAPGPGSEEQFITEHYWGYAAQPDGSTMEYRVTHPAWRVWPARQAEFAGDANIEDLYGKELAAVLRGTPASVFLAEGSAVTVMRGRRL